MQSIEAASRPAALGKVISMNDFGNRGSRGHGKLQARARGIDERFYSLDERSQRIILSHMIGYLKASKNLISSRRQARPDEISRTFNVMEDMINEAWKGGMI